MGYSRVPDTGPDPEHKELRMPDLLLTIVLILGAIALLVYIVRH
jgi:hypothetical protein